MKSIWACGLRVAFALCFSAGACAQVPVSAAASAPAPDPAAEQGVRFDILEFDVEGNTVLKAEAIEAAVTPFLGLKKTIADAEGARAALEKVYQNAGYLTVFVDLPEQRIDGGTVRLAVAEGRVERLRVSGSHYFSQNYIRSKVPELSDGKVPNFNEVQRELAAVNRTEDRRVQPIMRAGQEPGTVETELKVDDQLPAGLSVELNDRHAASTTPWRLVLSGHYDNLFQRDHSVSFSVTTAPEDTRQARVLSLNYLIPGDDQSSWVLYAINSNSNVQTLGAVDVIGKGTILGLRHVSPLLSTPDQNHSFTLGLDYKDLQNLTRTGTAQVATPLHYLPLSMAYNGSVDQGEGRSALVNVQMLASLRPVLRRDVNCVGVSSDQFSCNRNGGDGGFATLRSDLRETLALGPGRLQLRLGAQVASGPVPSGEQYTIGGADSVRGYLEAEGAGDGAVLGSMEWRSRDLSSSSTTWPWRVSGLGFLDVARAYTYEPATGQAPHISLAGAGLGLRLNLRKSIAGDLDLAWPLKATVNTPLGRPRLHVRFSAQL
jgi:hemolysin activation/secretion protein